MVRFSEFRVAALSILAARGEMEFIELMDAIYSRLNKNSSVTFVYNMKLLVDAGEVSKDERPATAAQIQISHRKNYFYYKIESAGHLARIKIAEENSDTSKTRIPAGSPKPAESRLSL